MSDGKFRLVFSGEVAEGADIVTVKAKNRIEGSALDIGQCAMTGK